MFKTISQTKLNREFKKNEKMLRSEPVIVIKNNEPAFATIPYKDFVELMGIDKETSDLNLKRYMEVISGKDKSIKGKEAWNIL